MAEERLDKLTVDQLRKKDREASNGIIISLVLFVVCFITLGILKPDFTGVSIPLLAPVFIASRLKSKIIDVLAGKVSKQEKVIENLKGNLK